MDLKDKYKQLTGIDIEQQKKLWDDRGKGYYGEFLVFCELYKHIQGNCKILMNLNIPTENNKTTEMDLLLIHETGIYVFEIKHYKGTIYGDDIGKIWTQYFRTVKNNTFKNPILQNEYHITALKNIIKDIPIRSTIVFTNYDCTIKVKNNNSDIILCTLDNLITILEQHFKSQELKLSTEEIDDIFNTLSKYSQMQEAVLYDGKEESFVSWLQPILQELEKEKNNLKNLVQINKRNTIKKNIFNTIIIIVCVLCFIISINSIKSNYNKELNIVKQNYNNELEKFKKNFKHIDEIDNEYITALNEYFSVSEVSINEIANNVVTFTAKISKANDIYGMALTKDSKYIVMTDTGNVFEYNVFGKHLNYNRYYNMIGKGIRDYGNLSQAQFYGVSKNEITYIKITNIELFKLDVSKNIIKENLELEIYSK